MIEASVSDEYLRHDVLAIDDLAVEIWNFEIRENFCVRIANRNRTVTSVTRFVLRMVLNKST